MKRIVGIIFASLLVLSTCFACISVNAEDPDEKEELEEPLATTGTIRLNIIMFRVPDELADQIIIECEKGLFIRGLESVEKKLIQKDENGNYYAEFTDLKLPGRYWIGPDDGIMLEENGYHWQNLNRGAFLTGFNPTMKLYAVILPHIFS